MHWTVVDRLESKHNHFLKNKMVIYIYIFIRFGDKFRPLSQKHTDVKYLRYIRDDVVL